MRWPESLSRWCVAPVVVICAGLGACGDSADLADAGPPDANPCATPELRPEWLAPYQTEVVGRLSGQEPISTGVLLEERASEQSRIRTQIYLRDQLAEIGLTPVDHDFDGVGPGTNILAELPGRGEGVYVFGAHFDSVPDSPGANDNATGVAAVLAAARILAPTAQCFEHGLVFAFFDQEELGLLGSRALAESYLEEGRSVLGVITLDQLGWDEDGDRLIEAELPGVGMFASFEASIAAHEFSTPLLETATAGSDHTAFRERGFSAMGITEGFASGDTTPHYHLPTDTFDTVDFAYLAASTSALVAHLSDLVGLLREP